MSGKVILPNELHLGQVLSKIIIILIVCLIIAYEFDDKLLKSRSIRLYFLHSKIMSHFELLNCCWNPS